MMFSQAIDHIEDRAARIQCEFRGEPLEPFEIVAKVSHMYPDESERLWTAAEKQTISSFDYMAGWVQLLESFEKVLFVQRLEEQLKNLQAG